MNDNDFPLPVDFRDRLKIDKHNLDEELVRQGEVFYEVSENLTLAISQRDRLKEKVAVTAAELSAESRLKAFKSDEKWTDKRIEQKVLVSKEYRKVFKKFLNAKRDADQWDHLKEAFLQRSHMLKQMVSLYCSNYYSEESISPRGEGSSKVIEKRMVEKRKSRSKS